MKGRVLPHLSAAHGDVLQAEAAGHHPADLPPLQPTLEAEGGLTNQNTVLQSTDQSEQSIEAVTDQSEQSIEAINDQSEQSIEYSPEQVWAGVLTLHLGTQVGQQLGRCAV